MKLTSFTFFKDTLFNDMQNTVHFNSNAERDEWFDTYFDSSHKIEFEYPFNMRRDRAQLRVPRQFEELLGYNYCRFLNGFDNKYYYAYVTGMEYLNDKTTNVTLIIDVLMTYTQGDVIENLQNVEVERQHLPIETMNRYMAYLRTNDDIVPCGEKYFYDPKDLGGGVVFTDTMYIIQSAVVLHGDVSQFGNEDAPKMKTANGSTFDGISTPINLYLCSGDIITEWTDKMSDYPWIMQNVKSIVRVPSLFFDINQLEQVSSAGVSMWRLKGKKNSNEITIPVHLDKESIKARFGLDPQEEYMLRNECVEVYLTDFRGNTLKFDTSKIFAKNEIVMSAVFGATNEINVYSKQYGQGATTFEKKGYYRDNEMVISQFDNVPVMIDNYTLNKANTAYQRQYEQSNLLSGRINRVTDSGNSLKDRVVAGYQAITGVMGGNVLNNVAGMYTNEYDYYRKQRADFKQAAITPPTVTEGTYTNANLRKTDDYGIYLRYCAITGDGKNILRRYYGKFGFECQPNECQIYDINSNKYANWVQFTGNYVIPNMDRDLFDVLHSLFEGGVRLWHSYNYLADSVDMKDNVVLR